MIIPQQPSHSSLPLYLLLSIGFHIIGIAIFSFINPKLAQEQYTTIHINIGTTGGASKAPKKDISPPSKPIPSPKKEIVQQSKPKKTEQTISKPILKQAPIKSITPTPQQPSEPVTPKSIPIEKQKIETPTKQIEQKQSLPTQTVPTPVTPSVTQPSVTTPPPVVQQQKAPAQVNDLSDTLDNLLDKKTTTKKTSDFLEGATWTGGTPRRTLSFPNLTASIPQQYRAKGYGFSVTAKITFSPQGWVSGIDLLQTSGDPRIDSIFRTELRKIRIESSSKSEYETLTKTFTISIK